MNLRLSRFGGSAAKPHIDYQTKPEKSRIEDGELNL